MTAGRAAVLRLATDAEFISPEEVGARFSYILRKKSDYKPFHWTAIVVDCDPVTSSRSNVAGSRNTIRRQGLPQANSQFLTRFALPIVSGVGQLG